MYIELMCHACKKRFCIPFDEKEFYSEKCPKCGEFISRADNARLYEITEKLYMNVDKLNSVTIEGIHTEKVSTTQADNTVFYADISSLAEVFDHATPEVKERVTSLMDTLFLLTYHDAKDGAIDKLDVTREKLRTIFLEKVDQD